MVILIGGSSCTGKTLLASQLMKEHGITYFSLDNLKMGLYRSDKNCGFTPVSHIDQIAEKLWPIVREMIKTYIENGVDVIIEGCYILPKFIETFEEVYKCQIYSVFLGFTENYINKNMQTSILAYKGAVENREIQDDRPTEQFIKEHNDLKAQCQKFDQVFFEIVSDYSKEIAVLKDQIAQQVTT